MRHLLQVVSKVPWLTVFHISHACHTPHTAHIPTLDEEILMSNDPGIFGHKHQNHC